MELTKKGADIGKEMRRRHGILLKFLMEVLKAEFDTADEEACKMEHALGPDTLESLVDFMEFIQTCPRTGENWLDYFEEYRKHGHVPEKCQARSEAFSCGFKDQIEARRDTRSEAQADDGNKTC